VDSRDRELDRIVLEELSVSMVLIVAIRDILVMPVGWREDPALFYLEGFFLELDVTMLLIGLVVKFV
jgi:hypothetical protein